VGQVSSKLSWGSMKRTMIESRPFSILKEIKYRDSLYQMDVKTIIINGEKLFLEL
jgi:hypothetical protein